MQLTRSWRLLPFIAPLFVTSLAHADPTEASVTGKGLVGGALLGGEVVMLTEAALKVRPAWAYYIGGAAGLIGGGVAGHYLESSLSPKSAMYMLSAGMLLVIPTAVASLNATSYDTPLEYTQDAPPADEGPDDIGAGVAVPTNALPTMPAANTAPTLETPPAPAATTPAAAPAAPPPVAPQAPATTPAQPTTSPPSNAPTPAEPAKPQGARQPQRVRIQGHWRMAETFTAPSLLDMSGQKLALTVPAIEVRDTYTRREVAMYGVKQQTEVRVPLFQMAF